jgi:N-acetylglutamate synthase
MINPFKIEFASYKSWPAFEQLDYQGWILRFANRATKRANSVNVLTLKTSRLHEAILYCESFFATRSQPTIFRLLSFIENANLDSELADANYSFVDPSLVLYQNIKFTRHEIAFPISHDRGLWLETYCNVSGINIESQKTHAEILARIPSPSLFAILEDQNQPVACGLGVIHDQCFGIFDLVTKQQFRNRGYGTSLMRSMISWAKCYGSQHCYLQVTVQNTSAIRLYEKLGYRYLYHYWYRVHGR